MTSTASPTSATGSTARVDHRCAGMVAMDASQLFALGRLSQAVSGCRGYLKRSVDQADESAQASPFSPSGLPVRSAERQLTTRFRSPWTQFAESSWEGACPASGVWPLSMSITRKAERSIVPPKPNAEELMEVMNSPPGPRQLQFVATPPAGHRPLATAPSPPPSGYRHGMRQHKDPNPGDHHDGFGGDAIIRHPPQSC